MLPSCGCSQFSLIVGRVPMFSRSMCVASSRGACSFLSSVIAEHTRVGPMRAEHLLLRALHDGAEREHVLLLGDGDVRGIAQHHRGPEIVAAFVLDEPRAVLLGDVVVPGSLMSFLDVGPDAVGLLGGR